jgi:cytochrome b subunit of formate dehydrogenase
MKDLRNPYASMSNRGWFSVALNALAATSFFMVAISGICLFLVAGGRSAIDPVLLVSRANWNLIHTWSGIALITLSIMHFLMHWRWAVNVTRNIILAVGGSIMPRLADKLADSL